MKEQFISREVVGGSQELNEKDKEAISGFKAKWKAEFGFAFPEKIKTEKIQIGGKTKEELIKELEGKGIFITDSARYMIKDKNFTVSPKAKEVTLIELKVGDLTVGSADDLTTKLIYRKAKKFSLHLCPSETGLHYMLQSKKEGIKSIAMKAIPGHENEPSLFSLEIASSGDRRSELGDSHEGNEWFAHEVFLFSLHEVAA